MCALLDSSPVVFLRSAATEVPSPRLSCFSGLCGSNIELCEERRVARRSRGARQSLVFGAAPIAREVR